MNQDDNHLVERILRGKRKRDATQRLYERHETYWFRICLRYANGRIEGQDLFQEGVARIFDQLKKFDPQRGSFQAWSNRVLVNAALQFLKRNQASQEWQEIDQVAEVQDEAIGAMEQMSAKELTEMIQLLPAGYRMVFNLYEIEGYSHQEIANQLNISVSTSKSQLFKAKKVLRLKLNQFFSLSE